MPHPEQQPDISVYQGNAFEAELSETETTFTAQIRSSNETVIFHYTPPGNVSFEIVSFAAPAEQTTEHSSLLPDAKQEASDETGKAMKLYGRSATPPFKATAPSGEPMTIVSFAEHPSWHTESLSNAQPEKVKEDTRYWQAAAFGVYAHVLDDLPKGKASILIGYPKEIKKVGKGGQEEIVKNGFQVVDRKPFLGTPKPKKP